MKEKTFSLKKKRYHELGWEILSVKRKVHKLILFYKIEIVLTPPYPKDLLKPVLFLKPRIL